MVIEPEDRTDPPHYDLSARLDAAVISIYTANISIIHGAVLSILVFKVLRSFIESGPPLGYANLYGTHAQVIWCSISVFAMMCWIAIEYYWLMSLISQRPYPLVTFFQFALGLCQIGVAYLVTYPRFYIWAVLVCSVVGFFAYCHS